MAGTARGGTGHLGLTHTETQRGRLWTACGQRRVDSKSSQTTLAATSTSSIRQLLGAADAQTAHHIQHSPNTPTTGLRERGNDTSKSTGRSGRQKAATQRNMRREARVTMQGPVKEQQPDGMSHRGEISCIPSPNESFTVLLAKVLLLHEHSTKRFCAQGRNANVAKPSKSPRASQDSPNRTTPASLSTPHKSPRRSQRPPASPASPPSGKTAPCPSGVGTQLRSPTPKEYHSSGVAPGSPPLSAARAPPGSPMPAKSPYTVAYTVPGFTYTGTPQGSYVSGHPLKYALSPGIGGPEFAPVFPGSPPHARGSPNGAFHYAPATPQAQAPTSMGTMGSPHVYWTLR